MVILGDNNVVKINFVQFNNEFSGVGVEDGMPLQGTFKNKGLSYMLPQCKIRVLLFSP